MPKKTKTASEIETVQTSLNNIRAAIAEAVVTLETAEAESQQAATNEAEYSQCAKIEEGTRVTLNRLRQREAHLQSRLEDLRRDDLEDRLERAEQRFAQIKASHKKLQTDEGEAQRQEDEAYNKSLLARRVRLNASHAEWKNAEQQIEELTKERDVMNGVPQPIDTRPEFKPTGTVVDRSGSPIA